MSTNYHDICWRCMNQYVGIRTTDGQSYDGFVARVDPEYVTLAVPTDEMMDQMRGMPARESTYRQFGFSPGFFPRRRFFERRIPFFLFSDLFLLPFFLI